VVQPIPFHVVNLIWSASTSPNLAGYNMYRAPQWRELAAD
jgi:hypothetical protein